jgi:hypothetical protein
LNPAQGLDTAAPGGPLPIMASRMGCLLDALNHAYQVLGLKDAADGDGVFCDLVLARIIEPASKACSARVLQEAGALTDDFPAQEGVSQGLRSCWASSGRRSLH